MYLYIETAWQQETSSVDITLELHSSPGDQSVNLQFGMIHL